MRRAVAALLTVMLVAACGSSAAPNVPASGGTTVTAPGEVPPITQVWFGTAFDPATMALTDRGTTFKAGSPLVAIATLLSNRAPEELTVTIEYLGSVRKTLPVTGAVGATVGVDLTPAGLGPGSYLISFKSTANQKSLASAAVTLQ
jgi:hypothetical protein